MKLKNATDNFLEYCEFEKGLSNNTIKSYGYEMKDYVNFLEKEDIKHMFYMFFLSFVCYTICV